MTLNERLEQIGGCGDGNCKVYIRPGQHTNGGCRCLRLDPIKAERVISAYRAELDSLRAQLAEQREIARELAAASKLMVDWANGLATNGYPGTEMGKALARFHAAEGE